MSAGCTPLPAPLGEAPDRLSYRDQHRRRSVGGRLPGAVERTGREGLPWAPTFPASGPRGRSRGSPAAGGEWRKEAPREAVTRSRVVTRSRLPGFGPLSSSGLLGSCRMESQQRRLYQTSWQIVSSCRRGSGWSRPPPTGVMPRVSEARLADEGLKLGKAGVDRFGPELSWKRV